MKKAFFVLVPFLGLLLFSTPSHAYHYWICLDKKLKWSKNTVNMRASKVSFAQWAWENALRASITRWNESPSRFRYTLSTKDPSVRRGNGQNEVWFSNDASLLNGYPAVAFTWWDCIDYWIFGKDVELKEVDVVFDVGVPYTSRMTKSNLWNYGGSRRPFRTTAIHELGHGVGLGHTNNTYNVMGQDWTHIHVNSNQARAYAGEDSLNGAVFLYGYHNSNIQDLSVTHWKYSGSSGQYSTHTKTKLYNNSGGSLSSFVSSGERFYRVNRGQKIKAEFTYENNGKSTRTVRVGFFVSTNSLVTTSDRRIGGTTLTLGRNVVYTRKNTITIPNDLQRGKKYWIGAIIDDNAQVSEIVESNNATYIPARVN